MAIAAAEAVVHLPFGERPEYGSPYPEGIAVAHREIVGDATGGNINLSFTAKSGFIYRLELVHLHILSATSFTSSINTSHRWAGDKSGLGGSSFLLTWPLSSLPGVTFKVYTLATATGGGGDTLQSIRRFPLGRLDKLPTGQVLVSFFTALQANLIVYTYSVVFTYWPKESLALPGFLSSFYEAPIVPTPLTVGA